ncbi:histidine kinase [Paenibacillus alginolyticus]|uniref:Histidine kinase n=1 Tax=Paenibacillus alginolyticus TaxID=59839 RepID=A0ABT4GFY0_9BACL|nr:histidine kinase [Paenibacillus alginolyticus]MCY9670007.1 histidine kinase [Paenibacillus alginolyticus]MCY9695087.1 histidine kinase [Paenibacillus alginolyticus]MEC0147981.1 histidine kinase [Paenibacillus alginolyticus]
MKRFFRLRDSSIFKKMLAAFMVVLLPLMAITWLINEKGVESIRKEISQSTLNTTGYYLDSLEKEADRIVRYLPKYVTDDDLIELAAAGNELSHYERAEKILGIQKRLVLMKDSSPFIQEAKAYVPSIDRTLMSIQYDTSINKQEYAAMQPKNRPYEEPFIYWNDRLFISMQYPANTRREPLFVVGVELSARKIKESLAQIGSSLDGRSILLSVDRGWHIQSDDDPALLETVEAFIKDKKAGSKKEGYETVQYGGKSYLSVFKYSPLWNAYSISLIPEANVLGPIQTYRVWFWWACVLAVVVGLFFSYFLFKLIYKPLMRLVYSFRHVQQNRLMPITIDRGHDEFGYLYQAFNDTIRSLRTLIEENYEQQIRNQRSELKRLQSQINPHFLYNCFFVLCRLIKSDRQKEKAYQFCLYIGEYFHFITRDGEDEIPLALEVKHSRTYVDMQTVCYGDRIQVRFDSDVPELSVPRLVLQPIIENAYKHALGNMRTEGELWVHFEKNEESLSFYVEDNGSAVTDEEIDRLNTRLQRSEGRLEETTGLVNVHRRIQLRYGAEYGITMARSALGGLKVRIHFGSS